MTGAEPRPGLRDVAPYVSPQLEVVARLNTNECPHPLPEGFAEDLADAVRDLPLHRYPDGQMLRLREALAAVHAHPVEGTWAANGSNEILTQLVQAYGGPGRSALVFEPTYLLHARICWLTNTELETRRLPDRFHLMEDDVDMAAGVPADLVFVCSPNNPTGNSQPRDVISELAERLSNRLIVVDEAYGEFSPDTSALPMVADHPNVAVVRTFSKAFAMAGARIGYVLAAPAVVEDLQRVRLPYHLSSLAQTAGIVALRHRAEATAILSTIVEQRDRLFEELTAIHGVVAFPSDANFVLFVPPGDAVEVWRGLLERGVLVRDMTAVVPNALRVTAGADHEVDLFLKALKEVLGT